MSSVGLPTYEYLRRQSCARATAKDARKSAESATGEEETICFFQSAQRVKTRYATLGFSDKANLDVGLMRPTGFALPRAIPGNVAAAVMGPDVYRNPAEIKLFDATYGFNQSTASLLGQRILKTVVPAGTTQGTQLSFNFAYESGVTWVQEEMISLQSTAAQVANNLRGVLPQSPTLSNAPEDWYFVK